MICIMVNYHVVRWKVAENYSDLMVRFSLFFLLEKPTHTRDIYIYVSFDAREKCVYFYLRGREMTDATL